MKVTPRRGGPVTERSAATRLQGFPDDNDEDEIDVQVI